MATTFSNTFKNRMIDTITGRASTSQILTYWGFYNGAQPAAPSDTPAGSPVYSSISTGPNSSTYMSSAGGGISVLSQARTAVASNTVTSLTFARIYDAGQTAMIDTALTLTGGGGGAIAASLASSATTLYGVTAFSFKVPLSGGTLKLSSALANALANAFCVTATNVAVGTTSAINIYSGAAPATADDAATGTLLVSFTCGGTSPWAIASGGAATLTASLTGTAVDTGTAGYARLVKGAFVIQGSVGTAATDFIIDTTSIVDTNLITLSDATINF